MIDEKWNGRLKRHEMMNGSQDALRNIQGRDLNLVEVVVLSPVKLQIMKNDSLGPDPL